MVGESLKNIKPLTLLLAGAFCPLKTPNVGSFEQIAPNWLFLFFTGGLLEGLRGKNLLANAREAGLIPESERSP